MHFRITPTRMHFFLFPVLVLLACSGREAERQKGDAEMDITVTSSAFEHNAPIPKKYTCEGEDVSPALSWSGIPEGTKSTALICDDPDAPTKTWVHWVLYNIPPGTTGLGEGVPNEENLPDGSKHCRTDFGDYGYGGPCPPKGGPHRYFFKVYALDTVLDLESGARKKDLEKAMEGHILASGELIGTYQR